MKSDDEIASDYMKKDGWKESEITDKSVAAFKKTMTFGFVKINYHANRVKKEVYKAFLKKVK